MREEAAALIAGLMFDATYQVFATDCYDLGSS
jgi:hypothetical protein